MILKVEVPFLDAHIPHGVLRTWYLSEGQAVEFGDALCDIVAEDYMALHRIVRPYNAATLARRAATRVSGRQSYFWKRGRVELIYRIISSEHATMRMLRVPTGTEVATGDLLALVSTSADEALDIDERSLVNVPSMKVAATHVELTDQGG